MEVGDRPIPTSIYVGILAYTGLHFLIGGPISIAYRASHATLADATYWVIYRGTSCKFFS